MKTYFDYFKRTIILLFAVGTLSSAEECDWFADEEIDCKECIEAQEHLCDALGRTNGRLDLAGDAVEKVKKACGGDAKVTAVHTRWLNNPTESCNDVFTCE